MGLQETKRSVSTEYFAINTCLNVHLYAIDNKNVNLWKDFSWTWLWQVCVYEMHSTIALKYYFSAFTLCLCVSKTLIKVKSFSVKQ